MDVLFCVDHLCLFITANAWIVEEQSPLILKITCSHSSIYAFYWEVEQSYLSLPRRLIVLRFQLSFVGQGFFFSIQSKEFTQCNKAHVNIWSIASA